MVKFPAEEQGLSADGADFRRSKTSAKICEICGSKESNCLSGARFAGNLNIASRVRVWVYVCPIQRLPRDQLAGKQQKHMAQKFLLWRTLRAFRVFAFLGLVLFAVMARAELQFDVFVGYDGTVREASWFPVTCEIKNNGPAFNGFIEIIPTTYGKGQGQRMPIELPTGTLKRVVIPMFAANRYAMPWDMQLVDSRGKVRAESLGVRPQRQIGWETKLIGALPRTAAGTVQLRLPKRSQVEMQPASVRFQTPIFPDNPLVLEGLNAIYLNSETAAALRSSQVNALIAWMNAGGHLIVAIEQISDVSGVPWLRNLLPVEPQDIVSVGDHSELERWLKTATTVTNYPGNESVSNVGRRKKSAPPSEEGTVGSAFGEQPVDRAFEAAEIRVVTGKIRDGRTVVSAEGKPLIVTANRGLGRVTTLMFSPEREPFKSWRELPTFWTIMLEVPLELYASTDFFSGYGNSVDGIFGAMIDSRQVHKLPVGWLLALLIVYLLVIGPLDRIWLKKINKPMLTWITFPCYVVLFSGLIYFIGYRLRAGDSEYNELHVVDVLPNGDRAELRGRTYISIYSPANTKYPMQSTMKFATLRGEYLGSRGGEAADRMALLHTGDSFQAEVFVPVWTSQLYLSDWWKPSELPLSASLKSVSGGWELTVQNRSGKAITQARLALGGFVYEVGEIPVGEAKTVSLLRTPNTPLSTFVNNSAHHYASTAQQRQYAFGRTSSGRIDDLPTASMVVSLLGELNAHQNEANLVISPGLDVSGVVTRGEAVLLAWSPSTTPVPSLNQAKTKRSAVNTLWRMPVAVKTQN